MHGKQYNLMCKVCKLYHRRAQLGICAHTLSLPLSHTHTHTYSLSLSLSLSRAGHLNTLALSTQTIHKCRIKKEIIKRAQFETETEGQDTRSRQKNRGSRC